MARFLGRDDEGEEGRASENLILRKRASVAASSAGGARIRGQLLGGIRQVEDPVPPDLASAAAPAAGGVLDSASRPPSPIAVCIVLSVLSRNLCGWADPGGGVGGWGGGGGQCPPTLLESLRRCQDIPQGE